MEERKPVSNGERRAGGTANLNFARGLFSFLKALFTDPVRTIRLSFYRAAVTQRKLREYVLMHAYYIWQSRGLLQASGVQLRHGDVIQQYLVKGIAIIVEIIMLVIAGYFAALLVPGLLTAIATTALTSVSSAVVTLFQTILPFTFVTVIIMLFLSVLVETFRAI